MRTAVAMKRKERSRRTHCVKLRRRCHRTGRDELPRAQTAGGRAGKPSRFPGSMSWARVAGLQCPYFAQQPLVLHRTWAAHEGVRLGCGWEASVIRLVPERVAGQNQADVKKQAAALHRCGQARQRIGLSQALGDSARVSTGSPITRRAVPPGQICVRERERGRRASAMSATDSRCYSRCSCCTFCGSVPTAVPRSGRKDLKDVELESRPAYPHDSGNTAPCNVESRGLMQAFHACTHPEGERRRVFHPLAELGCDLRAADSRGCPPLREQYFLRIKIRWICHIQGRCGRCGRLSF